MELNVEILKLKQTHNLNNYWTIEDYRAILILCDIDDANDLSEQDTLDMVAMAFSDLKPNEAAEIVLGYKFGEQLNENQIKQIAHDMLEDDLSQEYADISFHYDFFQINQFLYRMYNGKFINSSASIIEISLTNPKGGEVSFSKFELLQIMAKSLSDKSVILRLYGDQITAGKNEALLEHIIWQNWTTDQGTIMIATSEYLLDREDVVEGSYKITLRK
jgi:hypothetical protein